MGLTRILIEGADLTGKSTLARYFAKMYDLSYIHVVRRDPHTVSFYTETLNKHDVVFDRHFIGEMVYPGLFGRKPNLDKESFELLLFKARELGYLILICYEDDEVLLERLKNRPSEPEDVKKTILQANKKFKEIADEYNIPAIKLSLGGQQ